MPMCNLIEYSNNYSKTLRDLGQYYKDHANVNIKQSELFKYKIKIAGKTPAANKGCENSSAFKILK